MAMAIIRKKKSYYIDYYFEGRRIREVVGPSKRIAQMALDARRGEIAQGRFDLSKVRRTPSFAEFAESYLEYSVANKRSWERDKTSIKALSQEFGSRRLSQITPWLIEKYKRKRKEVVSPASVNRELACLKHMFTMAMKWGKAEKNPVKEVKLFRENNKRLRFLDKEEEKRLLDSCSDHLRPIVITALNTGMRRGEILSLRWECVDLELGIITIVNSKNSESRNIPINTILTEELRRLSLNANGEYVFDQRKKWGQI